MKHIRIIFIYFIVSIIFIITYPLYAKCLPEEGKHVVFNLLAVNMMISLLVLGLKGRKKPYFLCGKCNGIFPYPENRVGGTKSVVFREFCPYCERERLCYIKYYHEEKRQ